MWLCCTLKRLYHLVRIQRMNKEGMEKSRESCSLKIDWQADLFCCLSGKKKKKTETDESYFSLSP